MMLRKRTRSHQKHQAVSGSDSYSGKSEYSRLKNQRIGSFFSIPSLFVDFSKMGSSENDTAWSPTSPLDFKLFSGFANPFAGSSKSVRHLHQKSLDSGKVGLSIVDSLDDHTDASGKVLRSSQSKNILFATGMRFGNPICRDNPVKQDPNHWLSSYGAMSSPGSSSVDIGVCNDAHKATAPKPHVFVFPPSLNRFPTKQSLECLGGHMKPVSESEIELSEDYTCVISHGPNPKTTHFYGDRILESLDNNELNKVFAHKEHKESAALHVPPVTKPADDDSPSGIFLKFCTSCNKDLREKEIYMYRGYIGFCSEDCRSKAVLADEKTDKAGAAKCVASDKPRKDLSENKTKKKSHVEGVIFTIGSMTI